MSLNEIRLAVEDLPAKDRGSLAAWLLESLPPHSGMDASAEGIDEAVRRREELDSGRARVISADDFWKAVAQERTSWK
ncbi:MAG TPA: addiction module protein [Verrucomicrobiae bacterium]|nr:addiction module protein [Verrucomicrobiae bacterium]